MFDVDIDFADRNVLLEKLKHRVAKLENGKKHNTGVYFTEIPHDPATNLSTLDYETAEDRNYFKLDCLNVSIYKNIIVLRILDILKKTFFGIFFICSILIARKNNFKIED